ncbi:hypothetical protein HK102_005975 [Quaeritorhiza haematococci]|nr:hypothetical protein HK102_005975 [Quaeritorhiza haematococci]
MSGSSNPKPANRGGFLSFESQLLFYGQYHHNPINKFIHIVCVPLIFWTVLVWLSNLVYEKPWIDSSNAAGWVVAVYIAYYLVLEPLAGILYAPILIGLCYGAYYFVHAYGPQDANKYAIVLHVISWIAQFVGHGVAEKRAPALLDSLLQAFLLAPLFVWMEVLFMFGYRPALQQRLDKNIKAAIKEWKEGKEAAKNK